VTRRREMDAVGPRLSVVVPCYNESGNMRPLVEAVRAVLEPRGEPFEVVVTDDHSDDGSWEVLRALASECPFVRAQRFEARRGQSAALLAGMRAARGEVVITIDGDLQNDPADIPKLLDALSDCDCASGDRTAWRRKADGEVRYISSRIANRIRNAVTGERFSDSACNLRAFRRECVDRVFYFNGAHRFMTTLVKLEGFRVKEVPISARKRQHGKSKYGVWNRLFRASADLLAVRWYKKRRIDYRVGETTEAPAGAAAGRPAAQA